METNTTTPPPTNNNAPSGLQAKIKANQTPLLIILLSILTAFLVIIAIAPKKAGITPPPAQNKTVVSPADTTLTLSNTTPAPGAIQTVEVVADSGKNTVTGVQLELSFDPKLASNVSIVSGSYIKSPVELLKKVDYVNGRISYVIGVPIGGTGVQGSGTVAVITYTEAGAKGQPVTFKFLPKTLVASQGFSENALKKASNYTKVIGETATPSAQ